VTTETASISDRGQKLVALEAIRGIAAVAVIIHHALAGFAPRLHGLYDPVQPRSLFGTPLFALINGSAAVVVFFVLSGFVLTVRLVDRRPRHVFVAALKRWPRLALPVFAVNIVSGFLMAAQLYYNTTAAQTSGSRWLGLFFTWPSEGLMEPLKAAWEGAFGTFFVGTFVYNSNLWTMYYELWGSVIVFICMLVLFFIRNRAAFYGILVALWLVMTWWTYFMAPFVAGVALAVYFSRNPEADWSSKAIWVLPATFLLLGYHESLATGKPEAWYAFLTPLSNIDPYRFRVFLHTLAAISLIMLAIRVETVKSLLSTRIAATLGMLSFPMYLMHFIIISSIGSWIYIVIPTNNYFLKPVAAITAIILMTIVASLPIAALDSWWLKFLNRSASRLLRPQDKRGYQSASKMDGVEDPYPIGR
jgi:peptidoglycan/LPS O-acetylase OafA/YrhL